MPYAEGRIYHDADGHIMETPEWLFPFADPAIRKRMPKLPVTEHLEPSKRDTFIQEMTDKHENAEYRKENEANVMSKKHWHAIGSFIKEDRPLAMDLLGFSSQLMFNTYTNSELVELELGEGDIEYIYGFARAHNRAMIDFCSVDSRLLSTCYIPLRDFDAAKNMAAESIKMGAKALLIPSACPKNHSPAHIKFDAVWAQAEEAGIPIVLHVGGAGELMDNNYFENGLPKAKDFLGGAENFRGISFMAIPYVPMQTMSAFILDGVLDRFPKLKWGIIEQGASWVPGWMKMLDAAQAAFQKGEKRLRNLSLLPSEFVKRQVRVTPYTYEDVGWLIKEAGEEICLFSSDYPHPEGGRNPLKRFEASTKDISPDPLNKFYCNNFIDLMGSGLN